MYKKRVTGCPPKIVGEGSYGNTVNNSVKNISNNVTDKSVVNIVKNVPQVKWVMLRH